METLPPDPPALVGRPSVIDGDTLEIHGQRIRLWGVDAPEGRQTCTASGRPWRCGQASANALDGVITAFGGVATCIPVGRPDRYRRIVARCSIRVGSLFGAEAAERDLAEYQVSFGWAVDVPRYSDGAYREAEAEARRRRVGLWRGEFQSPWEWRRAQPGGR